MKPTEKPTRPNFSSGPCSKRPGYQLENLKSAPLGRSHRSALGKASLKESIEKTKSILNIPTDYHVGIVPASDTGAMEMALWSLLGPRGVDVFFWESFGKGWANDIEKESKLSNVRVFKADYGKLPDLTAIKGGASRQESVLNGLRFLRGTVRLALVHDAARPLLTTGDACAVLEAVRQHGAAAIGTRVSDSVKRVKEGQISESLPREEIWTVQTPQGAILEELLTAYEKGTGKGKGNEFTDEASALKACGFLVAVVPGAPDNIKITFPGDVERVEALMRLRKELQT